MKKKIIFKGIQLFSCIAILLLVINCSSKDDGMAGTLPAAKPQIVQTGTINSFGSVDVLSHSSSQSITVKGTNLTGDLSVTSTTNFEISLDDTNFSSSISIASNDANSEDTTIYVRFSPIESAVGTNAGTLSIQSSQATTVNMPLLGIGVSITPLINVVQTIVDFGDVNALGSSVSQSIVVNGDNLSNDITIQSNNDFEVSTDNLSFSNSVVISQATANDDNTVYIRFSPTTVGVANGTVTLSSVNATDVTLDVTGTGLAVAYNYQTFSNEHLAFGGGALQSSEQSFVLHNDISNIEQIKMFVKLECPTAGCNAWDVFAHVQVKDPSSNEWFEIGRYITPYGVDNSQAGRGFEIDVTDFKSLLTGNVELRAYIEVWGQDGWNLSVDFDYVEGTPDYPYYAVSKVLQYNQNSLEGVPYGNDASAFDLTKSIMVPNNAESTHLRTIITGWGHATPVDSDNRPCAEWCFRTHDVKINGATTFQHNLGPLGCASNSVSPQSGNWAPDRAGWCPGMAVPVRIDNFNSSMAGNTLDFEYDFEDWVSDGGNTSGNPGSFYAISTYVVVKSNSVINAPTVID